MARYVAEAVTTHAPLAKHMFFRLQFCAGLMLRVASLRRATNGRSSVSEVEVFLVEDKTRSVTLATDNERSWTESFFCTDEW